MRSSSHCQSMLSRVKLAPQLSRQIGLLSRASLRVPSRLNSTDNREGPSEKLNSNSPYVNKTSVFGIIAAMAVGGYLINRYHQSKAPESIKETASTAFSPEDVKVIFVLGGPGSGKGTQCSKLVNEKGFVHLSAGDLLRAEQSRKGSEYGKLIAQCIKEGTIVPQEVTIALLKNAISSHVAKGDKRFLVDGFPRKMDQALTFENEIVKSAFTLFFECPESVMLERLLERGKTSGRTDDNIESIKKRFRVFIDTSMPVVKHFDEQGKVIKVKCDEPVEIVSAHVKKALEDKGIN
ncbi:hypothetical protein OY671_000162 [Metschnikowia pulcherrima]|nr:hypothetical protein OY671_000162 [Metschnikowia pulcherrima]